MTAQVEFHFDFGSPNAYLSHCVIPEIERRTGASFAYVPVLLGGVFKLTNNRPPMDQTAGVRNKPEYARIETDRFIRRHRIDRYSWNPNFPVNTLRIMRGAVAAGMEGWLDRYVASVFRHMWEEPKKMDEPEVIVSALAEDGIDGAALLERTGDRAVKDRLLANTEASVARGTFGSPTFYVGNEIFFGKDRLGDVEAEIAEASR
ncbi:MAG: 2-hydroxychromene-2-carboxylate isomerase [Defluviicoccus sp.]|nr:2-hydroxychromene-2-carboxylate isomerase [Defluviicoccus sp.]MDE0274879.1 2-hydroxychromene-2-carboxylate isomerase [Defluviicoccus sp.]